MAKKQSQTVTVAAWCASIGLLWTLLFWVGTFDKLRVSEDAPVPVSGALHNGVYPNRFFDDDCD